MKYEEITRQLQQGKIASFYLLTGPEQFLIESLAEKIWCANNQKEKTNRRLVSGEAVTGTQLYQTATAGGLFSHYEFLWIKNCNKVKNIEVFLPYLKKPSLYKTVVFSDEKVDLRKKFWATLAKKTDGAIVYQAYHLFDNQIPGWINKRVQQQGGKIDRDAVFQLINLRGGNLATLASEIDKLLLFINDKQQIITAQHVEQSTANLRQYTVFELVDAMGQKRTTEALHIVGNLLADGEPALKILSMLVRQLRLIWQGRELKQQGKTDQELYRALGVPAFRGDQFRKQLRLYTSRELKKAFTSCVRVDLQLKSTAIPPKQLLSNLLLELRK